MFTLAKPIVGLLHHVQHGGMMMVSICQVSSSSMAHVLEKLVVDIGDITQVFTWDVGGDGAFPKVVMYQGVGWRGLLHSFLDRG